MIFEEAGYSTSNFIIEANTLLFLIVGFGLFVLMKFFLEKVTINAQENCFTKCLRKQV